MKNQEGVFHEHLQSQTKKNALFHISPMSSPLLTNIFLRVCPAFTEIKKKKIGKLNGII